MSVQKWSNSHWWLIDWLINQGQRVMDSLKSVLPFVFPLQELQKTVLSIFSFIVFIDHTVVSVIFNQWVSLRLHA